MEEFISYAKWILSGEHAVVRGAKAIVFPLQNFFNKITLEESTSFEIKIAASPKANSNEKVTEIIETLADLFMRATRFLKISDSNVRGKFYVQSNIPQKVGFGSSAAVCVNVAKIFQYFGFCDDIFSLARHLEDKFHKKSSGLDICVVLHNRPLIFENGKTAKFLDANLDFQPNLLLTYSGKTSGTSECAAKVQEIFARDPLWAAQLDKKMAMASNLCEQGFEERNLKKLADGINLCRRVFDEWGLCNEPVMRHIDMLFSEGAIAAKPVGSGLGGYVLSLWNEIPERYRHIDLTLDDSAMYYPVLINGENYE